MCWGAAGMAVVPSAVMVGVSAVLLYERKSHLCAQYINHDIPAIINTFGGDVWPQIKLPGKKETLRRRFFDPSDLEMIENEFRVILVSSNILGKGSKLDVVLGELVPSSNTRESRIRIVANAQDAPRTTERQRNSIIQALHAIISHLHLQL